MIHYKLKIAQYSGFADVECDIPEEIKFFCEPGTVGCCLHGNCEHYTTIVKTSDYQDWVESFSDVFGVYMDEIGEYSVLTIHSLHNNTPVPTIDRKEWFKLNNIDLSKYTLLLINEKLIPIIAYKIIDFVDVWTIDAVMVTRGCSIFDDEYYSMRRSQVEWTTIEPFTMSDTHETLKVLSGKEADVVWNTMIYNVIEHCQYQPEYVAADYDFNYEQKKFLKQIDCKTWKDFEKILGKKIDYIEES